MSSAAAPPHSLPGSNEATVEGVPWFVAPCCCAPERAISHNLRKVAQAIGACNVGSRDMGSASASAGGPSIGTPLAPLPLAHERYANEATMQSGAADQPKERQSGAKKPPMACKGTTAAPADDLFERPDL